MISSAIIFLILATLCFIIGNGVQKNNKELNIILMTLILFTGFVLGPQNFSIISAELKHNFDLLISIGLGIVGFVLGLKAKSIRQTHSSDNFAFLFKFIFLLLVVSVSCLFLKDFLPKPENLKELIQIPINILGHQDKIKLTSDLLWISLLLGLSSITSSLLIDRHALHNLEISEKLKKRIIQLKGVASFAAITLLGIILASVRSYSSANNLGISVAEWSMIAIGSGVFCGIIFSVFLGVSADADRIFLASIGAILFACGIGRSLGLSSLFINFVFGVTLSITYSDLSKIEKAVERLLGPAFVLLLFLAGMNLHFTRGAYLALIPIYVCVRFVTIYFVLRINSDDELLKTNPFTQKIGYMLFSQDLLPLTLALSFFAGSRELGEVILSIIVPSLLINALIGTFFSNQYLIDNSENHALKIKQNEVIG
jgi:hypothetical protein